MAQNIFRGLGVALITPFKADGSVDYQSLKRLVEFQIDNGADFLCILATTGEAPCLTQEEKDKITELVKDVNKGRVKILKYCGGNNTAAVVEEIKNSDWSGIDGIRLQHQGMRKLLKRQALLLVNYDVCMTVDSFGGYV